ncbi:hypothetical protein VFPPC_18062 [Pochonia chlamydosporia 170]|uniref:Uncharacterized protein n=1 Tax=Pochonia chlamydosporia 170 TaxID=1380566 RepID=A0A219APR8_METCM|nr:hypothetical protein VFPPC_18062 [Pochonia chlamydosporia 170]OWT42807.1 hypothetical protein VFPPC_18062 [Pochonia chlamydosporia 170]
MPSFATLQNKPCVIAFDLSYNTVHAAAVESPPGTGPTTIPCFPASGSNCPSSPYPGFFYSAARMENVCELQLSRIDDVIAGMVLCYSGGAEATLGSVFVPSLVRIPRGNSSGLWILVSPDVLGYPQVTDITVTRPLVNEDSYLSVRWSGKPEWWFGHHHRQCQLCYEGVSTQQTRI